MTLPGSRLDQSCDSLIIQEDHTPDGQVQALSSQLAISDVWGGCCQLGHKHINVQTVCVSALVITGMLAY